MHFGENVREVLSASCGADLRAARSRTPLPGIESPLVQKRVASDLERSFAITLDPDDVEHLTTIRAVLQCVRLRRWERETEHHADQQPAMPLIAAPALRERFVRYTPPAAPLSMPATASSFAIRKS
jgi:hypothetical protein